MEGVADDLLMVAALRMKGMQRRLFLAEVCGKLCDGNTRQAERRFGWGRSTIAKGIEEQKLAPDGLATRKSGNAGKKRSEEQNPQLAIDIRLIVDPHTHTDPELKTERRYTNLSAAEVRQALLDRGYSEEEVPSERTMRDILNRMNYRLKRIQKGKPLKKTKDTDAIFENVQAVRAQAKADPQTLEISIDTKTKVKLGEYDQGGKNPNRFARQRAPGARS
ncbi:MAG: hypothetical protein QGF59_32705 [Pirellulaceae bacterium]|jgi:hypothetical protein|nr:hypothetical protein [Pirellulaceae bacterium]